MTLSELYNLLEIENPSQFEYFEQLADLLENEEPIGFDMLYTLLSQVSADTLKELIGNYMEDLCGSIPDRYEDFFILADSIQQKLVLLAENAEQDEPKKELIQELYRFRQWYHKEDGAAIDGVPCSVMNALFSCRSEKFSGEEHEYDFSGAMDYEIDEMSVSIGAFRTIDVAARADESDEDPDDGTLIIDSSYDPYKLD